MPERFLTFDCEATTVVGILHEPECPPQNAGILIVVGGPQYRAGSHRQFVLMARRFAAAGYPVLRFDCRGMGDSGGSMRNFDEVDGDIRAAIDAFFDASPGLRNVTIFGLCDAASAALIYCNLCDSRVTGLILANPWIRTEVGEAQAYVRHYYVQRLLQRSFWAKMLSGHVSIRASLRSLATTLRRSLQGQRGLATAQEGHFTERMLAGFEVFRGRVLLIMSERDLTAREFDNYCGQLPRWRRRIKSPGVQRTELRQADHTFSSADALERASMSAIEWLDRAHLPR